MSVIAAALKLMRADGMDSDAIVAAVAEMEREMTSGVDRAAESGASGIAKGCGNSGICPVETGGIGWPLSPFLPGDRRDAHQSPARDRSVS